MLLVVLTLVSTAYASEKVIESPNLKIEIDGKVSKYSSVPIIVDGSTLLPLREVLVNIGVENDDKHIEWNGNERSVTVTKGSSKIKLSIGSMTANVDNESVTLSTAPIIYKDTTYIPIRFVSQSLGKEVVWDDVDKKVIIREKNEYDTVKNILEKACATTSRISKYKVNQNINYSVSFSGIDIGSKGNLQYILDQDQRIVKCNGEIAQIVPNSTSNLTIKYESYIANNVSYYKNPLTAKWEVTSINSNMIEKAFKPYYFLEDRPTLYSGLFLEASSTNDIVLKGNARIDELIEPTLIGTKFSKYKVIQSSIKIVIDKNTSCIKELSVVATGSGTLSNIDSQWKLENSFKNIDFNNINSNLSLPAELSELSSKAEVQSELEKGKELRLKGKFEEAIESFNNVIRIDTNNYEAYYYMAKTYENLSKLNEALQYYDMAINLKNDSASIYSDKGYVLRQLNRFEEAIKCYNKVIELEPNYAYAYTSKGLILFNLGKIDEAIENYNIAIQKNPKDLANYNDKGNALKSLGKI